MNEYWTDNESNQSEDEIPNLEELSGYEMIFPTREELYRRYEILQISRFMVKFSSNILHTGTLRIKNCHFYARQGLS